MPVLLGAFLGLLIGALGGILMNNPWSRGFWVVTMIGTVVGLAGGLVLARRGGG